jgi:hypothetical protein
MSGASVPYHLRPHKAVDRRLFLDLLARFERWKPLSDYVYVSMGAYPLEDHKLIHRHLGITRLIAFDFEKEIVNRQVFNKPIECCHCLHMKSGDLIERFDKVLDDCSYSGPAGVIVWLDYTDPKQLGFQIREYQSLLTKLGPGDIVRVTVNAHPRALSEATPPGSPQPLASERKEKQFRSLKSTINEFLPSQASAADMTAENLPVVISKAFGAATQKVLPATSPYTFCPLSIIRYADGDQMLSITGAIIQHDDKGDLLNKLDMASWPFSSVDWGTVHQLLVPPLTIRERLFLEKGITNKTPADLVSELGFETAADISIEQFLECYKRYYRFYPTLLPIEI